MIRVLHILHHVSDSLEGWHTYIAGGLKRVSKQMIQVCFTPTSCQNFGRTNTGEVVIGYRNFTTPFFKTIVWSNRMYVDLLKYLKDGWIIHVHGERGAIPFFLSKFSGKNSKIILQQHSGIRSGIRYMVYSFYKYFMNSFNIKGIIVPSNISMNFLKDKGVEGGKIFPISPGVGYDELLFRPFNRKEAREMLGLNKDAFIILYVGRFNNVKGFEHVLDIVRVLRSKNVLLLAVGGNLSDPFGKIFYSNLDYVKPFPRLSRERLPLFYAASDCFMWICDPWIAYFGGIGVSVLEAMAMGCPVISTTLTLLNNDEANLSGYVVFNKKQALDAVKEIIGGKREFNPSIVAERYTLSKYCQKIANCVYVNV
ncbi:MAG: glycosyltransferase family 4 protein [Candidatus Omnitrophica bacterium]|nr:glycosyltransferase family 4 protein [Candidatus Omnitrophota bacterium]